VAQPSLTSHQSNSALNIGEFLLEISKTSNLHPSFTATNASFHTTKTSEEPSNLVWSCKYHFIIGADGVVISIICIQSST